MNWRDRARAAISAASGQLDPGLTVAYQAGIEEERARWEEATGFESAEDYVEPAQPKPKPSLKLEFPGQWIHHDGEMRFVRGYPNGRYGYYGKDGEFVDVEIGS